MIGELASKIKELGLSWKEGAERFSVPVRVLYAFNRREKKALGEARVATGKTGKSRQSKSEMKVEAKEDTHVLQCAMTAQQDPHETQTLPEGVADGRKATQIPEEVAELIRKYRREHPDHGLRRIESDLKRRHMVAVSRKRIRAVLKEAGLLEILDSSFDRKEKPGKGTKRFEASYPGELYQMDLTNVYIKGMPVLYLAVIIDDHSRFCVGAELIVNQRSETMIGVLHQASEVHGRPVKLLTDQGLYFYTWSASQTRFQHYLDTYEIEHLVCEPHSPQTQGKVERLIKTLQDELFRKEHFSGFAHAKKRIAAYVHRYNYERGHQSLGGMTPSERFYGVAGETSRLQAELLGRRVDTEKGFLVFRVQGRTLGVVCGKACLEVYLDGRLLKPEN